MRLTKQRQKEDLELVISAMRKNKLYGSKD